MANKVRNTLGSKLLKLRTDKCLTEEELANELGVDRTTIYHWEHDKKSPNMKNRRRIARFYNIDPKDLN